MDVARSRDCWQNTPYPPFMYLEKSIFAGNLCCNLGIHLNSPRLGMLVVAGVLFSQNPPLLLNQSPFGFLAGWLSGLLRELTAQNL